MKLVPLLALLALVGSATPRLSPGNETLGDIAWRDGRAGFVVNPEVWHCQVEADGCDAQNGIAQHDSWAQSISLFAYAAKLLLTADETTKGNYLLDVTQDLFKNIYLYPTAPSRNWDTPIAATTRGEIKLGTTSFHDERIHSWHARRRSLFYLWGKSQLLGGDAGSSLFTLSVDDAITLMDTALFDGQGSFPVSDTFERSDAATLGANWTAISGMSSLGIRSNKAGVINPYTEYGNYYSAVNWPDNQYAKVIDITVSGGPDITKRAMALVRVANGAHTCYRAGLNGADTGALWLNLDKIVAGTRTSLGTHTTDLVDGDDVELRAEGNQLTVLVNGVVRIGPVTDNDIASGSAGLLGTFSASDTGLVDSWEGGSL
jgi:hypothetical protein